MNIIFLCDILIVILIKDVFMEQLRNYLNICEKRCAEYMASYPLNNVTPTELRQGATEYFSRGGKRLRPAFLSLCAGAMGGKEKETAVIPAMVSVELFHTFTLVHDDIIDNDDTRRGGKSVHVLVRDMFDKSSGASDYGRDIAILAGDVIHAMSVKMLLECAKSHHFSPETVIAVAEMLEGECINELISGEALDTKLGVIKSEGFDTGDIETTLEVMRQKTGVLFSYSARAGAMLGLDTSSLEDKRVQALGAFANLSGIAFQIRDDILGITSDEKTLGKPIGSDIREGKKTIILQEAYKNANLREKAIIERTVGNPDASLSDVEEVKSIFKMRGGLEKAESIASEYIEKAKKALEVIDNSEYKELLCLAGEFMTARKM